MATLLEDIKAYYEEEHGYSPAPPDGPEVDAEQVSWEVLDTAQRWGNNIQVVYRRGDIYVAINDVEPATEMQDWGDYGEPDIYEVEPFEEVVVRYRKK